MDVTNETTESLKAQADALQAEAMRLRRQILRMPRDADLTEIHAQISHFSDRALAMRKELVRRDNEARGIEPMDDYGLALARSYARDG